MPKDIKKLLEMRSTRNQQNELITRLHMFLDNELTKEAELELLKELKTNSTYRDLLDQEKSFREFIRNKVHRRKASPALIESLKEKIKVAPATPFGVKSGE